MTAATPSTPAANRRAPRRGRPRLRGTGAGRRTVREWMERSGLRRIVAIFIVTLFALSCGESLIADVCDGDETAALAKVTDVGSVTRSTGESDAARWSLVAHIDDSASEHAPTPDRPHGVHVCHCTHAHNGLQTLPMIAAAAIAPVHDALDALSDRLPPSPALEPQLRPPAVAQVA